MAVIDEIFRQEIRNHCDCPEKFQLIDALGSGLGAFFFIKNWKELKDRKFNGWNAMGLGLGAIMMYIHTGRFFYAKKVKR